MENLTKVINLTEIRYPVFKIGYEKPVNIDKVDLILRTYINEHGELINKFRVVDDKNIPEDTLAKRRIVLLKNKVPLKHLGIAIFFLGDMIKLATRTTWFIDSNGTIFNYTKSKSVALIFKKIVLRIDLPTGGSILEIEGIENRFKCLHSPLKDEKYAALLKYNNGYILYGVYEDRPKNSRRMI